MVVGLVQLITEENDTGIDRRVHAIARGTEVPIDRKFVQILQ